MTVDRDNPRITPDEVAALCAETAEKHGYSLTGLELQSWSSHLMVLGTYQYGFQPRDDRGK